MAGVQGHSPQIALVHNSAIPHPLGNISKVLADHIVSLGSPSIDFHIADIDTIDIANYEIPILTNRSWAQEQADVIGNRKSLKQLQESINKHAGFVFLFPYHIWMYSNPLKDALTSLDQKSIARKPVILAGFAPGEPFDCDNPDRTWKKESYEMMAEYITLKQMKVMTMEKYPKFTIYRPDYETIWMEGEMHINGQQSEDIEMVGSIPVQDGLKKMATMLFLHTLTA